MKGTIDQGAVLRALSAVLPATGAPIALHEPLFSGNERAYLNECVDTGWVSSAGAFVQRFEGMLEDYTGVRRAVAVVNGTSALHIGLKLSGVGAGDEVIAPALTFVATANAVSYCGAIPHFADSSANTLGIDPAKLNDHLKDIAVKGLGGVMNRLTGRPLKAVIAMHAFGHPVDIDPLLDVCGRFGIPLVEDAAQSLGSFYKGRHTGNFGLVAALSFNGNKIATTGGGGALLTNDERLADKARHLTTTARLAHGWLIGHDAIGYNYRMPNVNAALGCAQMERLPEILERKRSLALRYCAAFDGVKGVRLFLEPAFARSNYWLNTLILDSGHEAVRDALIELTRSSGIMTRPAWTLMHRLTMYKDCPRMDLKAAEGLEQRIINLPSGPALGETRANA